MLKKIDFIVIYVLLLDAMFLERLRIKVKKKITLKA
jgi:hypothetical protein